MRSLPSWPPAGRPRQQQPAAAGAAAGPAAAGGSGGAPPPPLKALRRPPARWRPSPQPRSAARACRSRMCGSWTFAAAPSWTSAARRWASEHCGGPASRSYTGAAAPCGLPHLPRHPSPALPDWCLEQVWELIICDPERTFEYAQYYPSNKINSAEVGGCRRCGGRRVGHTGVRVPHASRADH